MSTHHVDAVRKDLKSKEEAVIRTMETTSLQQARVYNDACNSFWQIRNLIADFEESLAQDNFSTNP